MTNTSWITNEMISDYHNMTENGLFGISPLMGNWRLCTSEALAVVAEYLKRHSETTFEQRYKNPKWYIK